MGKLPVMLGSDAVFPESGAPQSKKKKKGKRTLGYDDVVNGSSAADERNSKQGSGIRDTDFPESDVPQPKKKKRKKNKEIRILGCDGSSFAVDETQTLEEKSDTKISVERTDPKVSLDVTPLSDKKQKLKKKVRFQEPVEAVLEENGTHLPMEMDIDADLNYYSQDRNWKKDLVSPVLHYGKFADDEDEKIKKAVFDYIRSRGWEKNVGVQTVLLSSQSQDSRGCWLQIAKCLPERPVKQIYSRAKIILGDWKRGKWSCEEVETLKELYNTNGNNWKKIGLLMHRSPQLCKDKLRHLKYRTGSWSQEEFDKLCILVRKSLRIKQNLHFNRVDRRQLRDNINWEWIAEQMQRDDAECARMWYCRLASPMIKEKKWGNGDDRLLLQNLMELGATSFEAVDWDSVVDQRDGTTCIERWREMMKLLGRHEDASFEDKLVTLAKRYAPDLLGIEEE